MFATAVESTTLRSVAYDCPRQLLYLEFKSCVVYCYFGVPEGIYQALMAADSKGFYFNRNIRGRFPYQRLAATDAKDGIDTAIYLNICLNR